MTAVTSTPSTERNRNAMTYQPVPNVAQVRVEGRVDGQQTINNTFWEISGGGITAVNLGTLVVAIASWTALNICPLLSSDWECIRVTGVDLTTQIGPTAEQGVGTAGTVGSEAAPNNVAACVKFRTAGRGRSMRGRNFVPGIPNAVITLNTLDPDFVIDLPSAYNMLVGAGTFLPGWQWVVVSRFSAGVVRPEGLAFPVLGATMVSNSVRSMRTREVGKGS